MSQSPFAYVSRSHLSAYLACLLVTLAVSPTRLLAQAQVDGQGYVSLRPPTVPWAPTSDSTIVNRFIWSPATNTLLLGSRALTAPSGYAPNSFAFGPGSSAGEGGFAFGTNAFAGPKNFPHAPPPAASPNFALSDGATATVNSIAFGRSSTSHFLSTAIGDYANANTASTGLGHSTSSSQNSTSIGYGAFSRNTSVAIGNSAIAGATSITQVTAVGAYSKGLGMRSTAIGNDSFAVTDHSTGIGSQSTTNAIGQTAIGRINPPQKRGNSGFPAVNVAAPTDPVFVVGPGTLANGNLPTPATPNTLTIYRDGQVHLSGVLRVPPGGDIPMLGTPSGLNPGL